MTIAFPQVGHCPSWPDMLSLASRRLEQYPQLKPKRLPPPPRRDCPPSVLVPLRAGARLAPQSSPGAAAPAPAPPPPPAPAPAGIDCRCPIGTRSVVRHFGQRTSCPTCPASADRSV